MKILDEARRVLSRAVDTGRDRADELRSRAVRGRLIKELGELCFDRHSRGLDVERDIERLVARIEDLDEAMMPDPIIDLTEHDEPVPESTPASSN